VKLQFFLIIYILRLFRRLLGKYIYYSFKSKNARSKLAERSQRDFIGHQNVRFNKARMAKRR